MDDFGSTEEVVTLCSTYFTTGPNTQGLFGQVETDETENGNGKLKRKTETESGNGKAEIWKWSSEFKPIVSGQCAYRCIVVSVSLFICLPGLTIVE